MMAFLTEVWITILGDHGAGSFKMAFQPLNTMCPNSKLNTIVCCVFKAKDTSNGHFVTGMPEVMEEETGMPRKSLADKVHLSRKTARSATQRTWSPQMWPGRTQHENQMGQEQVPAFLSKMTEQFIQTSDGNSTKCALMKDCTCAELCESSWIQCDNCHQWVHMGCAGLQKKDPRAVYLSFEHKACLNCQVCKPHDKTSLEDTTC
uniref:Zinc finger PHD-type domain-containing protein n=1 Tax=Branchiostoma floridae TaxID=7739 RepID=C4A058_BRAFL|eukprot:XP_002585815.1 hypothetical protein BRAFLDRAFT_111070 [Branchiostoma floridae]